jgi:type II secretory pathway pseudopilin PulG
MKALNFMTTQALPLRLALTARELKIRMRGRMKARRGQTAGFSLVEVTLALGVAAICLLPLMALLPVASKTQQTGMQQTTANQIISQISSILRADVSLPPGQANKVCPDPPDPNEPCNWSALHGKWYWGAAPDKLFFTNEGLQTGNIGPDATPPPDAVFRARITYRFPPSDTTSLADIAVNWPAAVDPGDPNDTRVPAGYTITTIAVNR